MAPRAIPTSRVSQVSDNGQAVASGLSVELYRRTHVPDVFQHRVAELVDQPETLEVEGVVSDVTVHE